MWRWCARLLRRCGIRRGYLCDVDVDDIFVYETPKLVRIRDARLGLLYYGMVTLIAVYIVVWQLVRANSYLAYRTPTSISRLTLQETTLDGCNPNEPDCEDAFPITSSLPYCCTAACDRQQDGSCICPWRQFRNFDCDYLDGAGAAIVSGQSILVSTFIKEYNQTQNASCTGSHGCTKLWETNPEGPSARFVAGIKDFTILIDHSVFQRDLDIFRTSRQMRGYLLVNGTTPLQNKLCAEREDALTAPIHGWPTDTAPCYIRPNLTEDNRDIFALDTLMRAMGVSLDGASYYGSGHSLRYEGLTATLQIEYFNTWPWHGVLYQDDGEVAVSYVYQLVPLQKNPYKSTQLVWLRYPDRRIKRDVHGVYFSVEATGRLAVFDLQTLLLTLTTSLALLAVGSTIVKYLAIYVLKHRPYYKEMMYQISADLSDVRDLERLSDSELLAMIQQRGLPEGGTRTQQILRILSHGRLWEGSGILAEDVAVQIRERL